MRRWLMRALRLLILAAVLAGLAVAARALILRKKAELAKAPKYNLGPLPVHVVAATRGTLLEKRDYLAVVEPIRIANVSARLTAPIEKVPRDEGDTASKGDVLALLDDREIRHDIASVEAQIEQAKAELAGNEATVASLGKSVAYWAREAGRDATLATKGDIPAADAEATADKANEFRGRHEAAKRKSDALGHLAESLSRKKSQLTTQLGYCTIRSPYDGLITGRLVDPGDLASPGKTLLVVEDRSQLKLAFNVPQQDLPRVREGLEVTFTQGDQPRRAKLSHMYPSLGVARMLRAEVALAAEQMTGLRCGAYVPISVVLGRAPNATLVPPACLIECPKHKPHVFVVRNGKLEHPIVKVLASDKDAVAVEGIEPGEKVVTNTFLGWAKLAGGMKVVPVQ